MTRFSERHGYVPKRAALQIEEMSDELRNKLWNVLDVVVWRLEHPGTRVRESQFDFLISGIWNDVFKQPVDQISLYWQEAIKQIRTTFFSANWYEVCDLVEYIAGVTAECEIGDRIVNGANRAFEEELAGYRFLDGYIAPVTSKTEIDEVRSAISKAPAKAASDHLERALELLAQKPKPDYRNSIKESISAVESACVLISKKDKATLGDALKQLPAKVALHPALEKSFSAMYGYTSDEKGIRHAMTEGQPALNLEDARFMLVACSAFVNYLFVKANGVGIKLR